MAKSKQFDFIADADTLALIESLKPALSAASPAEVFKKALAITKLAVEQSRSSGGIAVFRGKDQPGSTEVAVALRA